MLKLSTTIYIVTSAGIEKGKVSGLEKYIDSTITWRKGKCRGEKCVYYRTARNPWPKLEYCAIGYSVASFVISKALEDDNLDFFWTLAEAQKAMFEN